MVKPTQNTSFIEHSIQCLYLKKGISNYKTKLKSFLFFLLIYHIWKHGVSIKFQLKDCQIYLYSFVFEIDFCSGKAWTICNLKQTNSGMSKGSKKTWNIWLYFVFYFHFRDAHTIYFDEWLAYPANVHIQNTFLHDLLQTFISSHTTTMINKKM